MSILLVRGFSSIWNEKILHLVVFHYELAKQELQKLAKLWTK